MQRYSVAISRKYNTRVRALSKTSEMMFCKLFYRFLKNKHKEFRNCGCLNHIILVTRSETKGPFRLTCIMARESLPTTQITLACFGCMEIY